MAERKVFEHLEYGGEIVFSNSRIFGTKMKLDKAEVDFDVVMEILHKYFKVRRDIVKI